RSRRLQLKYLDAAASTIFYLCFQLSIVVILELQDLPAVKNRKAIPTSCVKRDSFEFPLGPQPIVKLVARTRATLEKDLVCAVLDLVVTWLVVHKCFFSRLSDLCLTTVYCCHPPPNAW